VCLWYTIFRRIHFKGYINASLNRINCLFLKPLSCQTVSLQFICSVMVDRSIGREKAVHLRFLVYSHPLGYQYLECIVDILKVHRLPFGRGISICVKSIPSFMATCKHCSYARKMGKIPPRPLTLTGYQQEIKSCSYRRQVLHSHNFTLRIWRDSTLTLFQVQINFAVFPDSKVDSGKKNKVFHILAVVLITERKVHTSWHRNLKSRNMITRYKLIGRVLVVL